MTMRIPPQGQRAACNSLFEVLFRYRGVLFVCRGRPRDHTAGKDDARIAGKAVARTVNERIFACAAGTNHKDESTWANLTRMRIRHTLQVDQPIHATRLPDRHVARTMGTSPATCTRIRSAR